MFCCQVVCSVEGSGHWADNLEGIHDLKELYLMDMAEKLQTADSSLRVAQNGPHYLDVLMVSVCFVRLVGMPHVNVFLCLQGTLCR